MKTGLLPVLLATYSKFLAHCICSTSNLTNDDFDQFDKPGAERSWRRRAADEDWDSELEDDLLGEDLLSGKKVRN